MMKTRRSKFILLLAAWVIVVAACSYTRNTELDADTPTAASDPSATVSPTEVISAPEPEVPLIMNRGAPANSRCVAMLPGSSTEMPAVYLAADNQSTLVARLGNWADVQEIIPDWYSITLLEGGIGWVEASAVELSMGCGTSGPIRIEFAAGATATTIEGKLPQNTQVEYVFGAAEGQWLDISVMSPENSILFHLEGVQDRQVIKHLLDGESSWQGTIPFSQDYLLTIDNSGIVATYTIYMSIQDEPETGP